MSKSMPMRALEQRGVPYEVHEQVQKQYTAEGVAEDLGVPVAQVAKAMIVRDSERRFAVVVIPGDRRLSLKKVAAALDDWDVELASERDVQRVTGFQVGAVSVLGFRRADVMTYVDDHIRELDRVIISSGRPDAGLGLSPQDLERALEGAVWGDFSEDG
ncbi:MAG: YbaK/EbsC family protein [Anaerolineae bacterium]